MLVAKSSAKVPLPILLLIVSRSSVLLSVPLFGVVHRHVALHRIKYRKTEPIETPLVRILMG